MGGVSFLNPDPETVSRKRAAPPTLLILDGRPHRRILATTPRLFAASDASEPQAYR